MFFKTIKLAAAAAVLSVGFGTVSANATTLTFDLFDHPDRGISGADYGVRIEHSSPSQRFFSFQDTDGNSTAQLSFDLDLGLARILGTVRENGNGTDAPGTLFTVDYLLQGIEAAGSGGFKLTQAAVDAATGSAGGNLSNEIESIELGAQSSGGVIFEFDGDDHRFRNPRDAALINNPDVFVGRGWVNIAGFRDVTSDFLFYGELADPGDPGVLPPVPLPAAGWMLIAGVAGLGAMSRRRKKA